MGTVIYLIRHSKVLRNVNYMYDSDNLQIQNEKKTLSIEGERLAQKRLNATELKDVDVIYSSNYVRTIDTAKYLLNKNCFQINIIPDLGERKFGINSWDELPKDFEKKQFLDDDLKLGNGESQKEVRNRMYNTILKILNDNKNKRIAIVSHGTAISYLLKKWCNTEIIDNKLRFIFNDKVILDGVISNCEVFKLVFDDNNILIDIDNITNEL